MKTNLDKYFKPNEQYEKEGVWLELSDTIGFLVKPFKPSNPKVKAAMALHYKPFARMIEMGTLDESKELEIQIKIFLKACLVDWKGVEIDGADTKYSPEAALQFFTGLPDLFRTLWEYAQDSKNYRDEVGNS